MADVLGLGGYERAAAPTPFAADYFKLGKVAGDIGETQIAVDALQKSLSLGSQEDHVSANSKARQPEMIAQTLFGCFLKRQIATRLYPSRAVKAGSAKEWTSVSLTAVSTHIWDSVRGRLFPIWNSEKFETPTRDKECQIYPNDSASI